MRTQPSHGQQRVFFLQCSKPRRAPVDMWPPTSSTSDGAFSWLQEFVCGHQTGQVLVQLLPTHLAEPLGPPLEPWTRDWEGTASTAFASQDSLQRSELGETAVHLPDMFTTAHTDAVRIVFLEVTATQTKRHESKWLQEPIEDTARHEHESESTSKLQPSSRVEKASSSTDTQGPTRVRQRAPNRPYRHAARLTRPGVSWRPRPLCKLMTWTCAGATMAAMRARILRTKLSEAPARNMNKEKTRNCLHARYS